MKTLFAAGLLLAFSACPLFAQVTLASTGPQGLQLEIGGLSGSAASLNASLQLKGGVGAEAFVGFAISKYMYIGFVTGFDSYAYANNAGPVDQSLEAGGLTPDQVAQLNVLVGGSFDYEPVMGEFKWVLDKDAIRPFVLLGAGVAHNEVSTTTEVSYNGSVATATGTASETDFLLAPGAGALLLLDNQFDLFIQFRIDIDFTSKKYADTGTFTFSSNGSTVTTTAPTNLTGDSPTFFIPLEAGLDFNL